MLLFFCLGNNWGTIIFIFNIATLNVQSVDWDRSDPRGRMFCRPGSQQHEIPVVSVGPRCLLCHIIGIATGLMCGLPLTHSTRQHNSQRAPRWGVAAYVNKLCHRTAHIPLSAQIPLLIACLRCYCCYWYTIKWKQIAGLCARFIPRELNCCLAVTDWAL